MTTEMSYRRLASSVDAYFDAQLTRHYPEKDTDKLKSICVSDLTEHDDIMMYAHSSMLSDQEIVISSPGIVTTIKESTQLRESGGFGVVFCHTATENGYHQYTQMMVAGSDYMTPYNRIYAVCAIEIQRVGHNHGIDILIPWDMAIPVTCRIPNDHCALVPDKERGMYLYESIKEQTETKMINFRNVLHPHG